MPGGVNRFVHVLATWFNLGCGSTHGRRARIASNLQSGPSMETLTSLQLGDTYSNSPTWSSLSAPLATLLLAPDPTMARAARNRGILVDSSSPRQLFPYCGQLSRPCVAMQDLSLDTPEKVTNKNLLQHGTPIENATFEFPAETGPVERAQRALTLWLQTSPILLSYLRLYSSIQIQEKVLGNCLDEEECEVLWDERHEAGSVRLAETFRDLKGFYVKVGQIINTRQDLFPRQYSEALTGFTDLVDPMDSSLVRAIVAQELLNDGEAFSDVFAEFDDEPLGAASVAQVHRARLTDAYGGGEVAVKIQRPSIEAKLLGDIAALKSLAKTVRRFEALPIDYYVVFSEIERQLAEEFDFVKEAAAMERIGTVLATSPDGMPCKPPVVIPRPVAGLVTKRVLVMDYLKGVPLSRSVETMRARGIDPDSPEAKLFGRRLLSALTEAFGRTILETGFFHADPHPGNVFVLDDGRIGLIDFGQVKQISAREGATLAKVMLALAERTSDTDPEQLDRISRLALELGVELKEDAAREGPAATAMWLFDGSVETLPGGYDNAELSPDSPVKALKSFPQGLVLVARSTVLIKGVARQLGVPWSLAYEWEPIARRLLDISSSRKPAPGAPPRMRQILRLVKQWTSGKVESAVMRLPGPFRQRLAAIALRREEKAFARRQRERDRRKTT